MRRECAPPRCVARTTTGCASRGTESPELCMGAFGHSHAHLGADSGQLRGYAQKVWGTAPGLWHQGPSMCNPLQAGPRSPGEAMRTAGQVTGCQPPAGARLMLQQQLLLQLEGRGSRGAAGQSSTAAPHSLGPGDSHMSKVDPKVQGCPLSWLQVSRPRARSSAATQQHAPRGKSHIRKEKRTGMWVRRKRGCYSRSKPQSSNRSHATRPVSKYTTLLTHTCPSCAQSAGPWG